MPEPNPQPQVITLKHPSGLRLQLMDYGATWLSCQVPLSDGQLRETLLGHPSVIHAIDDHSYLNTMIGRFANRIGDARIYHQGQTITLQKHPTQRHQLHGGPIGFNQFRWEITHHSDVSATFSMHSADGDQGFPGALDVVLTVSLTGERKISLSIVATVTKDCPVCITHHPYFNLDAVHSDVRQHHLQIVAEQFLPIDASLLPLGMLRGVDEVFDFRQPRTIASRWLEGEQQQHSAGYDHAYLLNAGPENCEPAAQLTSADGKLQLRIATTLPAMQLYTGQFLNTTLGRDGNKHNACAGVALEAQFLPDSPNHPEWPQPTCWLSPGTEYRHEICYHFVAP